MVELRVVGRTEGTRLSDQLFGVTDEIPLRVIDYIPKLSHKKWSVMWM